MLQESEINLGTENLEFEETASEEPFFSKPHARNGAVRGFIGGICYKIGLIAIGYFKPGGIETTPLGILFAGFPIGLLGVSWGITPLREKITTLSSTVGIGFRMYIENAKSYFIK